MYYWLDRLAWVEIYHIDPFFTHTVLFRTGKKKGKERRAFEFELLQNSEIVVLETRWQANIFRGSHFLATSLSTCFKKRADYYLLLKTLQSFLFVFCYCKGNLLIQEKVLNFCYSSIFSCYIKVGTIFFSSLRIYRRPKIMPTKQMNRAKSRKC